MNALPQPVRIEPILEVRGLSKFFGGGGLPFRRRQEVRAVEDVSLALYPGRITALVGESGSGKSTVARLLAQLYKPTTGEIIFQGQRVTRGNRDYRSQVQMIFQDPFASLNPVKRIRHALYRPLAIHHIVPRNQVNQRIVELLESVGLVPPGQFASKYPHQLSGGQRQRVSIARALAVEPAVLLADEPISMLDVSIRMGILNLMLDLKVRNDIAFLYITHDIASARYVADEILVMFKGRVVEQGDTDAVLQNPLHPYTGLLLSAVPNPERGLRQGQINTREGREIVDPDCADLRLSGAIRGAGGRSGGLVEAEPGHWVRCRGGQEQ